MQVEKRSLNWLPKPSAWDLAQSQREKRKANSEAYIANNDSVASTFQGVRDNLTYGMAELTAKIASARVSKTA
jgi:hypothetical protein